MGYKELYLAASLLSMVLPSAAEVKVVKHEDHPTESVRGIFVLHWEYPYFIRRDKLKEQVFEIRIEDAQWMEKHLTKRTQETMISEPLFCVSATGYEDRKRLGKTSRTTFVFVKITSTVSIDAKSECERGLTGD